MGCFQLLFIKKIEFFLPRFPQWPRDCSLLATGTVLIYLMLHGWVIVFVQWGVAGSPALLGWMWDSPPPRCALLPHKLFSCLWKVLVAFPALCHLVLLVVPAGEGSGRSSGSSGLSWLRQGWCVSV